MSSQGDFVGRVRSNWRGRASESTTFRAELRVIPRWLVRVMFALYVIAAAAMTFSAIFAPIAAIRQPLPLRLVTTLAMVTLVMAVLSAIVLFFGYIGGDARRRGMSPVVWVLVAMLVPYLIGAILYFVVREPLPFNCPQCGRTVNAHFNFCPGCQFNLRPNCPQCRHAIRAGDRFCPHCGFALQTDAPARESAQTV
jgi:predicted membrane channel-forming protein YqfA (hemolysin III family)